MAKKKKNKSTYKNLFPVFIIATFLLLGLFFLKSKSNNIFSSHQTNNLKIVSVQDIYKSPNIFSEIDLKDAQINPDAKTSNGSFYYPEKVRNELKNSKSQPMRCMPEQIYINRKGYAFSILQNDSSTYKEVLITDKKVLDIIEKLNNKMPNGYTLSQFIACQTNDGRYIVKYNGIAEDHQSAGYFTINPVAFISQIFPDGKIQDASYITLNNSFCRVPMLLTKNNQFYLECDSYFGENGTGQKDQSYIYRVDFNKLNFDLLSQCSVGQGEENCSK